MQPRDASANLGLEPTQPTETVTRPEPGTLARGVWEAPAWTFYAGAALVLLAAAAYAGARFGWWKRRPRSKH